MAENQVLIIGGAIALEAVEDKIIIVRDPFKSGYECKTCGGSGKIETDCECVELDRPGKNRLDGVCSKCGGDYKNNKMTRICPDCNGKGGSLIIPEMAKAAPTTGTIMSVGPGCKNRKVGERVLFGAHAGTQIPFKDGTVVIFLREHEPLCTIKGAISLSENYNFDYANDVG